MSMANGGPMTVTVTKAGDRDVVPGATSPGGLR